MIKFFVPGKPEPAGSKKAFVIPGTKKDGTRYYRAIVTDDNAKSKPWKTIVAQYAGQHFRPPLLTGAVEVRLTFYLSRPAYHFNTKGEIKPQFIDARPTSRPDVLKLARGVEDALTGIIWIDDAQICLESLQKVYTTHAPGVAIEIDTLGVTSAMPVTPPLPLFGITKPLL